jgi:dipeptidyl aminopeptidase/acylaminoacyl peptidase
LAFGRTPASDWVQISVAGTDAIFWAASDYLRLSAPLEQLPVLSGVILPTPTPTIQPTSSANELGLALLPTPTPRPSMPSPAALSTSTPLLAATRTGKTGLSGTLVFQDRIGGTIYVYNLGTDSLRALSGGIDPAISPDGSQAAFTRDGGVSGLYVINLDGSDERRLYNDRELLRSPKWSPDGSRIVFTRSNGYIDCRILKGQVCMPDDAIFDLLPDELQDDMQTHKVIQGLPNQRQYFFTLSRLRLDNGEFRDIAAKGAAGAPDWSYGGIVYQSDNGLQRTDDQPDAESVQVAQDVQMGNYIDPDQQPNGGRIVFQHSRGGHWQIYGINPDGSGLAALTSLATVMVDALPSNVSPAWSPDGQHIVYLSNRNSYESAGPWHLWVMNGDGSEQRRLPIDIEFNYAFGSEQMVSWGP